MQLPSEVSTLAGTFAGPLACLAAALCWAVAVSLFEKPIAEQGARAVNLGKNTIAAALLGVTVLALGRGQELLDAPLEALALIAASGLVGLTLGDTALFAAVVRIGVHRSLLLQSLAPLFTALLAIGIYGERLGPQAVAGAALTLTGVVVVLSQRPEPAPGPEAVVSPEAPRAGALAPAPGRRGARLGVFLALVAAFGQGSGVVLAKAGLEEVPSLSAAFLRLAAAALGLVVVFAVAGRLRHAGALLVSPITLRRLLPATLVGTYLAMVLMMAGIAWAPASIAAVLLATPPIFGLFLDAAFRGVSITARGLGGTLLAVAGVALLTWPT